MRPASGSEIVNSALAEALTRKVEFTRAELERVGLRGAGGGGGGGGGGGELRLSSFIAVGDSYFQPAEAGRTYKIHIGFAREAPNVDAQGFNLYHNNRLIKPMWEVYKSPSSVGRGVVGVVEVDFVQPSHDKQDFERTDAMNRLESKLKLLVPAYWKANGRRVGYQSADPLPRELKEHAAEQIRAADASDASGDDDDDAPPAHLAHSRLFGSDREGGRKRKLPMHMESYRIYHSVARKDHPATRKEPPAASGLPRAAANGGGSGGGGSGGGGASGNAAAAAAREGGCGESSAEGQRLLGGAARIDSSEVVVVEAVRVVGEEGEGSAFGEDPPRSTMLVAEATAVGGEEDAVGHANDDEVIWVNAFEDSADEGDGAGSQGQRDEEGDAAQERDRAEADRAADQAREAEAVERRKRERLEAMHAEHAQLDQQIADMQEKKRKLEAKMLEEQLALEMERDTDGEEDEDGESELDVDL